MDTRTDEIADRVYRFSTCVPEVAPGGFTFNQFLIDADEPLLFHPGPRPMFPLVSAAVPPVLPPPPFPWVPFAPPRAPGAGRAHATAGCSVSPAALDDTPPPRLVDGGVFDLGGRRVRHLDTPHVPHGWEARVLFEETTRTLFCGDLLTHTGDGPALTSEDVVEPAMAAEGMFLASSLAPATAPTIRRLAALEPQALALMHGSSTRTRCGEQLRSLADRYQALALP